MKIKHIKEAIERMFILVLLLAVSFYAWELKNGVYDTKEKIDKGKSLTLLYSENGLTINVDIDKNNNKNIRFYFDNKTNRDFSCLASVECGNECILESSMMDIPAYCEDYGIDLFGAWRENWTYVNGVVFHIQLFDKHSFEKIYSGSNEFIKGENLYGKIND